MKNNLHELFEKTFPNSKTNLENLNQPDAILIQAPAWGVQTVPFNLGSLSAYARERNFKILPLDLNVEFYHRRSGKFSEVWDIDASQWFWGSKDCVASLLENYKEFVDDVIKIVIESRTKIVGFSLYSSSMIIALHLIEKIKKINPEICIIVGGPHAHRYLSGNHIALNPFINAVVQSEGEEVLIDIIKKVQAADYDFSTCTGLLINQNGTPHYTGDRTLIRHLDMLPIPDFTDYNFNAYLYPQKLPMATSRGCPNKCIFCSEQPYWETYRFRSADSMIQELEHQKTVHPHITSIDFQDSLINGKVRALTEFADGLIKKKIQVNWGGQAVIRKEMTYDLLRKLKQAGCNFLAYGLETSNTKLMMHVGKNLSKDADVNLIAAAHNKTGLNAVYNVMFGLPSETEEDAFLVLEFIRRHAHPNIMVNPSASFCAFSMGTPVWDNPEKYKVDLSDGGYFWSSTDGNNNLLIRLKRFEDFCALISDLGVRTTYPTTSLLNRNQIIAKYYILEGRPENAVYYYQQWYKEHPEDTDAEQFLEKYKHLIPDNDVMVNNEFLPKSYSDVNWTNGINNHYPAALLSLAQDDINEKLVVGAKITFANNEERTITKIEVSKNTDDYVIYFNGDILNGKEIGWPFSITVPKKDKKVFEIKEIN